MKESKLKIQEVHFDTYKAISGFVYPQDILEVLRIYIKGAGVVPPVFIYTDKNCARVGYCAAFNAALGDDDMARLSELMDDFEVEA